MKKHFYTFVSVITLFFLAACSTVPITGRSRIALMTTPEQEEQLGNQAWQEIQKKEHLTKNKDYADAVKRVGENIAAVADAPDFKWEFKTFESNQANAFCLPGGKVAVYTGIFQFADCDAELAAVMGHEIGHAIARHGGERIAEDQIRQAIGAGVVSFTNPKYKKLAEMVYGGASEVGFMLPYSRTHEYEADHIGLILMAKAGYDPNYALSFWNKFAKISKMSAIEEFISTHPISTKRLEQMRKYLPQALKIYNNAPRKLKSGEVYTWKKSSPKK